MGRPEERLGLATTLWDHQRDACRAAYRHRGFMLALEMGCGKTACAIALAQHWGSRRILITSPLSVVSVWPREISRHLVEPWDVVALDRGSVKRKTQEARTALARAQATRRPTAVVVNHESFWREPFVGLARSGGWDLLIVDESHRAKAAGGKFSRALGRLREAFPRRLALTGTPVPHSPMDLYAQFRFLDPSVFGTRAASFRARYAEMGGFGGKEITGWKDVDDLNARFHSRAAVVRKRDCLTLPPTIDTTVPVHLGTEARAVYEDLERRFAADVEAGQVTPANALVRLLRLQQVTSGFVMTDAGEEARLGTEKADALADLLRDCTPPVVVFCRFSADLAKVHDVADALGWRYRELSGKRRDALSGTATLVPEAELAGVQIQSGGLGVDLTRADRAVYYSEGFSLGDYEQSRARLDRPGQTRPVTFHHLTAVGTVDEQVRWALEHRRDVVESIVMRIREGGHDGRGTDVRAAEGDAAGAQG